MSLLQGREHLNKRLAELCAKLAPTDEPAESVAGELIRAVCRIVDSFYSDYAMLGSDAGSAMCNPAARYIFEMHPETEMIATLHAMWDLTWAPTYEKGVLRLADQTVQFVESHPELEKEESEYYFEDFTGREDREFEDEDGEDDEWGGVSQEQLDLAQYPPRDWRR